MIIKNFIDKVNIFCKSGNGGNGIVHFKKEKYILKGGPDGGDGGDGGSIFLRGNPHIKSLLNFRYKKIYKAQNGLSGQNSRKRGPSGKKVILNVPIGTIIKNKQGKILCEILHKNQETLLLPGGKGGLGNWHFKNSINKSPVQAQPGFSGRELWISLELKILADVGIVGFPNVGKSTLLSALTSSNPKIGNYTFTTLKPKLGIVKYSDKKSFIISDIPGIIKGSSKGRGLGLRFLRYIETNIVLLFLISSEETNIRYIYKSLLQEISYYNYNILEKNRLLAISKYDIINNHEMKNNFPKNIKLYYFSSHYFNGLNLLTEAIYQNLRKEVL